MVDVHSAFINSAGTDFTRLRLSSSAFPPFPLTSSSSFWENNDISSFLDVNEETQVDLTISEPVDTTYYVSSPEQFSTSPSPSDTPSPCGSDASPYSSGTPSPFDASLFPSPQANVNSGLSDLDGSLFEQCNLNPMLLPEIEKILASSSYSQSITTPAEHAPSAPETTSKKRQRDEPKSSDVILSRDQLLTMTSKEIEDYVAQLKQKRTLTASEEKDLKKQRRLVKNREYASQSRTRKKQYVDELEKQLEHAKAETDAYRKQNHALQEENKILKRQLGSIADAIKKSAATSQPHPSSSSPHHVTGLSSSSGSVGVFAKFASVNGNRTANTTRNVSACLLAIFFMVFTFAAFWDNEPAMKLFPNQDSGFVYRGRHLMIFPEQRSIFADTREFLSTIYDCGFTLLQTLAMNVSASASACPSLFPGPCPHDPYGAMATSHSAFGVGSVNVTNSAAMR